MPEADDTTAGVAREDDGPMWLVRWSIWLTEDEPESIFQGPFDTRHEAEGAASDAYGKIDIWHDASWSLKCVYPPGPLPRVRYTDGGR